MDPDVARLEAERLKPSPRDPDRIDDLFRKILDLIAAECRRAGWLK
jgi:hypothetical protein